MLIAYATLPGFVSYRDHVRGTWFIESLCKVIGINIERFLDTVGVFVGSDEAEL